MSGRFWVVIFSIFGLLLVGMATLQGKVLLLALPLITYLVVAILNSPGRSKIQVERSLSARVVEQDSTLQVQVKLQNEGAAIDEVYFEETLPPGLSCETGELRRLSTLAVGSGLENELTLRASRGKFNMHQVIVDSREHFGLFESLREYATVGDLQSVPEIPRLRKLRIRPRQTRGFVGPIPSRSRGSGMIFWGVREFHLGDALRQINWKVSSRHEQSLYTNEFEVERIADVGLILDARTSANMTLGHETLFEHSVLATAALAEAFLEDGHRVSMLIYGYGVERVYPGYGKIQRERILHALAGAETGSNYALENFRYLPTRLFPAQSQLVVVSPLNQRDHGAFVRLRKSGYEVLLVSPNPVEFEARAFEDSALLHQARRLARLERDLSLRRLTRLGIQVVDWSVDQPLEKAVQAALGRQPFFLRNVRMVIQ
jgi:uncharacterized protein (DUF58 family)